MTQLPWIPRSLIMPRVPRRPEDLLSWAGELTTTIEQLHRVLATRTDELILTGAAAERPAAMGSRRLHVDSATLELAIDLNGVWASISGSVMGWHNVRFYGAAGDGTTNDTAAIQAAINAAAAESPRGVVYFPAGTYVTTGNYNLNGLSGLRFIGSGVGSTVIELAHATNDLFHIGATVTSNLGFEGFQVTSATVTRTGGWVFHVNDGPTSTGSLLKSYFLDLEIRKQFNGLAIKRYEFVSLADVLMWDPAPNTTGVALRFGQTTTSNANQGSEAVVDHVNIYGNNLAGGSHYWGAGVVIEDCDAVYLEHCSIGGMYGVGGEIIANAGGHAPANHFLRDNVFDATQAGPCFRVTGHTVVNLKINGGWFASAGRNGAGSNSQGFYVDAVTLAHVEMSGCNFYNNVGTGLYAVLSGQFSAAISGCTFNSNGSGGAAGNNDGVYIDVPINAPGPVITGCQDLGANGVSIRTSATANRLVIVGNRWVSGTAYGIAPNVNASNGT